MTIRYATDQDIPKIIELLKMSLGESLMPKSEAYWRWKHVDNPFGRSPVLVAEDAGELMGVRAFMRWEWTDGNCIYKSVRAVDTATHPNYQGRGIFKKLTLQLVDECSDDVSFIFNTPNAQSRPGYLKMGWEEGGSLPIRVMFNNPLAIVASKFFKGSAVGNMLKEFLENKKVIELLKSDSAGNIHGLMTNYSIEYLKWRYELVPVVDYRCIFVDNESNLELLIYRLKKSKIGIEFRITDYFSNGVNMSDSMLKLIRHCAYRSGAIYITFSGAKDAMRAGFVIRNGPMVTIRDINYPEFSALRNFDNWQPSIGDLELF